MLLTIAAVLITLGIMALIRKYKKDPPNLFDAARKQDRQQFEALLNARNLNLNIADFQGLTPLMHSIKSFNDHRLTGKMLELGANPHVADKEGNTALHYATMQNNTEIVRALINKGVNKNCTNNAGKTPLDIAGQHNPDNVSMLLY